MDAAAHCQFIEEVFTRTGASLSVTILLVAGTWIDLVDVSSISETGDTLTFHYRDRANQTLSRAALDGWYMIIRRAYATKFVTL